VDGPVDPELFVRALEEVVRRHSALRLVFGSHDGVPRQRILERTDLPFQSLDLRRSPSPDQDAGRLVQVPVDVGAELARPGARVDVIGQAQDGASNGAPGTGSDGQMEAPAQTGPENGSTIDESAHSAPTALPSSSPSSSNQESPGIQKPSQSLSQGIPVGPFGQRSTVLCAGARGVMVPRGGGGSSR